MAVDKLVDSTQLNADLTSVANAIRAKGGASASLAFPDGFVDAIGDIETGGGVTVSPLSVTANGTYTAPSGEAYSPVTVNVSGGGGASNVVTGTFTGTTKGQSLRVPLSYDGTGDPIAVLIYPSEGAYNPDGAFYQTIQRYAALMYAATRNVLPIANTGSAIITRYKSSTTSSTSYSQTGNFTDGIFAAGTVSSSNAGKIVRLYKSTAGLIFWVFIASTSYGFMADIPYTYHIIMSE